MLVITRRVGETVRIGNEIELTVSEIRGKSVRLAISAPKELLVLRGELATEAPVTAVSAEQVAVASIAAPVIPELNADTTAIAP